MNKKRYLCFTLIIIACMLSISMVNAADLSTSDNSLLEENTCLQTDIDTNDELILESSNDELKSDLNQKSVLKEVDVTTPSLSDLNTLIHDTWSSNTTITLDSDYVGGIPVKIDRPLTIDGGDHTLDGNNSGRIFQITADNVILRNINFVNGSSDYGGAILWYGNYGQVNNCNFSNNTASISGAAIYWGDLDYSGANPDSAIATNGTLTESAFIDNHAKLGGAIYWFACNGTVSDCSFHRNDADYNGGALYLKNGGEVLNSNFTFNNADNNGGGIYSYALSNYYTNTILIDNCSFINNTASAGSEDTWEKGGGAFFGNANITRSSFINNSFFKDTVSEMSRGGGAIHFVYPFVSDAANCTFINNTAGSHGGAIWCRYAGVSNCIFLNNTSDYKDTICLYNDSGESYENYVFAGRNNWFGNTEENYNQSLLGGEVDCVWLFLKASANPATLIMINSTEIEFKLYSYNVSSKDINEYDNTLLPSIVLSLDSTNGILNKSTATLGEKIKFEASGSGTETVSGTVEEVYSSVDIKSIITDGTTFWDLNQTINNNSDSVINLDKNYTFNPEFDSDFISGVNITRALTIKGNGYTVDGLNQAAFFDVIADNVVLNDTVFTNAFVNRAINGAIFWSGVNGIITNCTFSNNTANGRGGAIAFDGDNVTISGCVFINNTANKGGGAIAIPLADNFRINNNIFLNNKDGYGEVIFLSILANYNIDYNWFGNTALNYKIKQNYGVDHWLFLNATANPDELTILDTSEITFKLYLYTEDGIREYNNSLMPPVNLTLSSVNGDLSSYSAGLDDSVTFTPLSRATAEISAKWETVEYSIQLEVKGADSKLNVTLSPTEISFGDNATLHLEYNPNATGTVNISIAGKKHKYSMEDIGLNASVILSGLLPDEYNITVIYSGDENFTGATLTPEDSLTVKMLPSNMEVTSFDIYVNDTNGVMFNISLDESATGSLKLSGDIEKEISLNDGQKENGKTVILIENTGLAVGKYNVSFSYSGDEIYENSTESSLSRIMIIQTQVIAKNDSIELTAGDESWMEYTLIPSDAVGEITFSSNDTTVVEVNSTGEIRAVGEGIAMVTITFSGNENYTSSNATVEVKVNRIDTEIDIDSGSPVAHNSTNATITLKSAGGDIPNQEIKVTIRDGNGNVLYNDSALTGNDGSLKVSYTPLSVSPITITAVFDGSTVYNGSGNEITADPSEIETVLNIDVKDTVVDGKTDIIINITDINGNAVEGTVSLSFDDDTEDVRLDINNLKQLIYTYNNTNRGKNVKVTAVLNVPAGSGYGDSNDSAQFNVARLNSTITSDNITAVYGSGDYLLIALKDINGNAIAGVNISVNLNGISQYSTDENGTVKVSTMNLDVNGYTAEITFAGNERYIESETAVNVTIEPAGSSVSAQNVNISYGDILSINVVSENATNVTYEIRDENDGYVTGEVIAPNETISGLDFAAGKYTLNLTANVDGNHISSSSLYNITVNKASSIINADNVEIIYGETVNLTVSSVNTTELTYKITDKDKSTIANGTIQSNDEIILSNLDAGEYTVEISYGGNENYTGSNASAKITVSPAKSSVSGENVTVTYGDAVSINVVSENATAVDYNVLDSNGVSVKTGTVDSNGIITDLDLAAGKYTLNLTAVVDSNHVSSSASSSITVNKASSLLATEDVNVTYGNEVSINVSSINATELTYKVIDSGGKTVANGTVKANGTITVKGLSAGKYTVEIIFAGNENYTASSADSSITVKKASPKITAKAKTFKIEDKTKKYTVTLKNNKGKVMKNIKVTLKVNGVTYTAKTNSNGVATFKLTKLNRTGSFTAVIGYAGNNNYKKVTKKVKLTVKYTWKTISRGSKDKAMVKKIQRALKKNHFYISYKGRHLKVDGIFHVYTEMAVKEFQRAKKLKVTGKVDYATAKKLKLVK